MSAAAAPPPPPPPPEFNPQEPKPEKKNRSKLPMRRRQSPKVATPSQQPTRNSFILPWLEGKLENKPSSFPGEGSSSSPSVLGSVPVLAPIPISALAPQINESRMLGVVADAASNELIAVYDPFYTQWYYLSLQAYDALFGQNTEEEEVPKEDEKEEENVKEDNIVEEKEVQAELPKQKAPKFKTIQIGEIEVPLPIMDSDQETNINPTGLASSSSNVQDEAAKEEAGELASVEQEHGQKSGNAGQKKGKKKKNKGKKK